jgi:hypothetical protein
MKRLALFTHTATLVREAASGNSEGIVSGAYLLSRFVRTWLLVIAQLTCPAACFTRSIGQSFGSVQ